jgi:hypothetical protein
LEALELHFETMQTNGDSIPEPTSLCEYVDVKVDATAIKRQKKPPLDDHQKAMRQMRWMMRLSYLLMALAVLAVFIEAILH